MRIQEALRALPTKPGVTIAIMIIVLVCGWYGYSSYTVCTHRADLLKDLTFAIEASAAGGSDGTGTLDLGDVADFAWDEVRIVQNYRPTTNSLDCPFGWHWSEEARRDLAARGLLTILAFFQGETFVDFMDYSGEVASFEVGEEKIARADAVFSVTAPETANGPFLLRHLREGN